ncbi:MAG: cytochrome c [Chloroflexi bacterium]|uniref:C-type cytochrome n=1 Tax=Candidatus Chlorohelix allophototropha TaxID=3003348 RepID=A0A8T7M2F0_9CHLR|nr:cytochrome c [Chloroflexota bacterium]WJW66446.1 c-type cytochrome [Chloroflexota bacterium L227-S17]
MSTRMVMSIAFALAVVLGMLLYILNDNSRASLTTISNRDEEILKGAQLFAANCSQCHGPKGEGAIGPALNRPSWKPGDKNFDFNSTYDFINKAMTRGQFSPQPGIAMPAWSRNFGGPLTDEQIDFIITYIIYGNWDDVLQVLTYTQNPNFSADLPANAAQKAKYPDADKTTPAGVQQKAALDAELASTKKLIMQKGCLNCHAIGSAGTTLAPNLTEVGSRRTRDWLYTWIEDPTKVPDSNRGPNVQPWFSQYSTARTEFWPMQPTWMPAIQMTVDERNTIVDYISELKRAPVTVKALDQATPTPTK